MKIFADFEKKVGGILKVADGNERVISSIAIKIFSNLNLITKKEKILLKKWSEQKIINHAKIKVGEIYSDIK